MTNKIYIASDHAGFELKEYIISELNNRDENYNLEDLGTNSKISVDYPDFGNALADKVAENEENKGILICGSGVGISIAANRNPKIRAALCYNEEITKLCRQHNNANVICLGERLIEKKLAVKLVDIFLNTEFEGGRHQRRVNKLGAGS